MNERIFIAIMNGKPYRKDSAIRTYKSRERAEKETRRFASRYDIKIGELTVTDLRDISKEDDE